MKSWKEVPHLFANERFGIHTGASEHTLDGGWLEEFQHDDKVEEYFKLIARPISDMSDEELKECPYVADALYHVYVTSGRYSSEDLRAYLIDRLERLLKYFDVKMHLLSRGVYPFGQDNSKDVIWRYENDESNK